MNEIGQCAAGNPFAGEAGLANSCYGAYRDERLVLARDGSPVPNLATRVHDAFRALVLDPEFPCIGARSAISQASYRFGMYPEIDTAATTAGLAYDLFDFVREQEDLAGEFSTFIACFDAPKVRDGVEFESLLWGQLKRLHDVDAPVHGWDPSVSQDVDDPRFSFSFGGRAFFIVGLSPAGTRWARTFPWPAMAFNAHFQFERLRATGQFGKVQRVIRDRDRALEGDINPNLADFGEHTEARQYSGREVPADWRPPARFEAR